MYRSHVLDREAISFDGNIQFGVLSLMAVMTLILRQNAKIISFGNGCL